LSGLRAALAALALLLAPAAAHACADFAAASSSRWQVVTEGASRFLATPCGDRFYSLGINVLDSEVPKREVPGRTRYDWRRFYATERDWAADTMVRARNWGFNTSGGWSAGPEWVKLPIIPNLELGRLAKFHWFDPFDTETESRMREIASRVVAPYKGSPFRIGYFSDNEVGWWGGALFHWYSFKPADNHTKQRWVEMLRDVYDGDFARFARDFAPPAGAVSWETLLAAEKPTHLRAGGRGIQAVRRWTGIVAEHYYAMIERVLREADPEALIFGDRLPIYYDPVALRAMARHVDVMAINYNVDSAEGWIAPYFFDGARRLTGGKPILISEWFYAARENRTGNRNNGHLMTVDTQAQRAQGAAAATLNFAAVPEIVGSHWFQFPDHPRGGRVDGEDYNFGLVDADNHPYAMLTEALGRANREAPAVHAAARPDPGPRALAIPPVALDLADHSLRDWPKPSSLLPPLQAGGGDVAFGEVYMGWDGRGLDLATIGQDYFDIDLFAYEGEFPLGEAYRLELGIDAGAGPRRFTLFFIPPRTKLKDHPPMAALLCAGAPATRAECQSVDGARTVYFGADQPRITAELFLPWAALGLSDAPARDRIRLDVAVTAFHNARWMSLSGMPPEQSLAQPERWPTARLLGYRPNS
jgi:hypothetical protein